MCDIQLNGRSVASRNWRTLRVPLGSFIYVAKNRNAIIAGGADWPRETSFWARDWSNGCSGVESGTHVSAVHTAFYKRGDCCGCSVEAREEKNDNKKLAKSRSPDGAAGCRRWVGGSDVQWRANGKSLALDSTWHTRLRLDLEECASASGGGSVQQQNKRENRITRDRYNDSVWCEYV